MEPDERLTIAQRTPTRQHSDNSRQRLLNQNVYVAQAEQMFRSKKASVAVRPDNQLSNEGSRNASSKVIGAQQHSANSTVKMDLNSQN